MAVTEFTAAISGSGKSYRRCAHYLATEFLPMQLGNIWTNFPIFVDAMIADVLEHHPDMVASELRSRIRIIPDDVLKSWRDYSSGPWDYFSDKELDGDRIAIDEIHNYVPKQAPREIVQKWMEFLGELRHRGCNIEVLSQYDSKVHKSIRDEAGLKRDLFNCEQRRDPFFQILMGDWYNLRAKFITGQYTSSVFEFEYIPVQGKWKLSHTLKFAFEPRFFKLYDSYSAPVAGGKKATGPRHPYIEKTKRQLVFWFLWRNWFNILWRFVVVALIFWLCFLGGAGRCIDGFLGLQKSIMASQAGHATPSKTAPVAPAGPPAVASDAPVAQPVTVQAHDDQVRELRAQITAHESTIEKLKSEIVDLHKQLDRQSDITLLGMSYALTRSGYYLQVGDVIPSGIHQGKRVASLDYRRRAIILDDGTRCNLSK